MSTQPPVRYENYPPDDDGTPDRASGAGEPHTPVVRPYVPETIPRPPARGRSRRTVIGLVVGIPLVAITLGAIAAGTRSTGFIGDPPGYTDDPDDPDDTDDPDDPDNGNIVVGDHSAPVPDGWSVIDGDDGAVEVTNGANRLTAVFVDAEAHNPAVEEIARLAKGHYSGFTGKIGDPVDRSSADLQHATMDGKGTFKGVAARLLTELWVDDLGAGLLVTRILTAKVSSKVALQAQEMVDQLSGDF